MLHAPYTGAAAGKTIYTFPFIIFFNFSFLFGIVIDYIAAPILGTRFAKKFYNYINSFTFSLRGM